MDKESPVVEGHDDWCLCIDCRIAQAEQDRDVAIKLVEELKKEKENVSTSDKHPRPA